ncbi:flagellar basal body L-ring protein FlgH [Phreatobacter aquaticus]|uniref:Flagellar L-ring protein n=2 Tax=Phreatobacter aquaticus TaxID=2570229 RepID=A0A4D7QSE6_9HYPH|nr:flagellar basal body L-ring protein FlgH [Phreatobacter aquaticus]
MSSASGKAMRFARPALVMAAALTTAACGAPDRLRNIGQTPALSAINNPHTQTGYRPVSMPMPDPVPVSHNPNSLWRNGSRAFFRDQRAQRVGDILTIKVKITDQANVSNETDRSRSSAENMGATNLFGLENFIGRATGAPPGSLVNLNGSSSSNGKGTVQRSESLATNVAAVVTQILPNGNLVLEGKQEVRVNAEVRELIVAGIVRPEDIESDNTIDSAKIAQARIGYGGRGQITDVQQPRYGQQVLDVLLPW